MPSLTLRDVAHTLDLIPNVAAYADHLSRRYVEHLVQRPVPASVRIVPFGYSITPLLMQAEFGGVSVLPASPTPLRDFVAHFSPYTEEDVEGTHTRDAWLSYRARGHHLAVMDVTQAPDAYVRAARSASLTIAAIPDRPALTLFLTPGQYTSCIVTDSAKQRSYPAFGFAPPLQVLGSLFPGKVDEVLEVLGFKRPGAFHHDVAGFTSFASVQDTLEYLKALLYRLVLGDSHFKARRFARSQAWRGRIESLFDGLSAKELLALRKMNGVRSEDAVQMFSAWAEVSTHQASTTLRLLDREGVVDWARIVRTPLGLRDAL